MEVTRRQVGTAIAGIGALGGIGLYVLDRGYPPHEEPLRAVARDDRITAEETDVGYVVRSGSITASTTGLVLYPGGLVDAESYVPTAAPLVVDRDLVVVIPKILLELAVFDSDAADDAIDAYPAVDRWYVGGHSLGGAMACRYAAERTDRVEGLVLMASYCDGDISGTDLRVLSILGTADEVLDRETERESRENLPDDARFVEIEGMVHSQFGAYGPQRGDGEPTISDREARQRIASTIGAWLDEQK